MNTIFQFKSFIGWLLSISQSSILLTHQSKGIAFFVWLYSPKKLLQFFFIWRLQKLFLVTIFYPFYQFKSSLIFLVIYNQITFISFQILLVESCVTRLTLKNLNPWWSVSKAILYNISLWICFYEFVFYLNTNCYSDWECCVLFKINIDFV